MKKNILPGPHGHLPLHCFAMPFDGFKHAICFKMQVLGYVKPSVPHARTNSLVQFNRHGSVGGTLQGHFPLQLSTSAELLQDAHNKSQESPYDFPSDPHTSIPGNGNGMSFLHLVQLATHVVGGTVVGEGLLQGHFPLQFSTSSGLVQVAHNKRQELLYVIPFDPHTSSPGLGIGFSIWHA